MVADGGWRVADRKMRMIKCGWKYADDKMRMEKMRMTNADEKFRRHYADDKIPMREN